MPFHRQHIDPKLVLYLKGYDPNQPRVPAGSSAGGQWTSSDGGTGASRTAVTIDDRGQMPWERVVSRRDDGDRASEQTVYNRDGSRIWSAVRGDAELDLVTMADGSRTMFETTGATQTIRDGRSGALLSASEFRPGEAEPLVQLAQVGSSRAGRALGPAWTLHGWRSTRPSEDEDEVPVLLRGPMLHSRDGPSIQSRSATMEEVQTMCRRYRKAQEIVDEVATDMRDLHRGDGAAYGRELHRRVKERINRLGNPNFLAEQTFRDGGVAPMNSLNSSRLDITDKDGRLWCTYEVRTGREGYSLREMRRHADAALLSSTARTPADLLQPHWLVTVPIRPRVPRW